MHGAYVLGLYEYEGGKFRCHFGHLYHERRRERRECRIRRGQRNAAVSYRIRWATMTMADMVTLRKNMALKWYQFTDAETNPAIGGNFEERYFSLTIGFEEVNFDSFTVAVETTQMSQTKDGKTTNEITFTPNDAGSLDVTVNDTEVGTITSDDFGSIKITLRESDEPAEVGNGTFFVDFEDAEGNSIASNMATFTNIGKYYAQYASSSADTPITPLTFKAEVADGNTAKFSVLELNGQSFELDENDYVLDNVAPALVINSEIKQFVLGEEIDLDYVAIDVCSSTVTTNRYYDIDGVDSEAGTDTGSDSDTSGDTETDTDFGDTLETEGYATLDSDKRFFETEFPDGAFDIDGATGEYGNGTDEHRFRFDRRQQQYGVLLHRMVCFSLFFGCG